MNNLKTRFAEDLTNVNWQDLIPHAQRDAIIIIDHDLDIIEVGVAIAEDDVDSIQDWISRTLIHKPFPEQLKVWNADFSILFNTLIVQPFVLIQRI